MKAALHPLRLKTRTDAEVSTIFHSFFFIDHIDGVVRNIQRIPQHKFQIENIESGLVGFLDDIKREVSQECFGNFVITSSDGSIFNAFWRGYQQRIFVGISDYFFPSFARRIFNSFTLQSAETLYSMLLELSETPIIPISDLIYSLKVSNQLIDMPFSSIDQPEDTDLSGIILRIVTPQMLVTVWESLLLERKVLIVSANTSVVTYCCELFRRLVLPLSVMTFAPFLPTQTLTAIEAPFPYLVGGCTKTILENQIDLSETMIVDLDTRIVTFPSHKDYIVGHNNAPSRLLKLLLWNLNNIMLSPLTQLVSRVDDKDIRSELDLKQSNQILDDILACFVEVNLSLITARACSGLSLPTFFRRHVPVEYNINENIGLDYAVQKLMRRKSIFMGFLKENSNLGCASGTMQMLKERYNHDENMSFDACWIEMDDITFAAYELADDLPLAYFSTKDIRSISPLPIEPEGHVFEMILTHGKSYRFVATDEEARKGWIDFIEDKMNRFQKTGKSNSQVPTPTQRTYGHVHGGLAGTSSNSDRSVTAIGDSDNDDGEEYIGPNLGYLEASKDQIKLTVDEELEISKFRYKLHQTQMVSNLYSSLECGDYEVVFRQHDSDCPLISYAKELFKTDKDFSKLLPPTASLTILDFLKKCNTENCRMSNFNTEQCLLHVQSNSDAIKTDTATKIADNATHSTIQFNDPRTTYSSKTTEVCPESPFGLSPSHSNLDTPVQVDNESPILLPNSIDKLVKRFDTNEILAQSSKSENASSHDCNSPSVWTEVAANSDSAVNEVKIDNNIPISYFSDPSTPTKDSTPSPSPFTTAAIEAHSKRTVTKMPSPLMAPQIVSSSVNIVNGGKSSINRIDSKVSISDALGSHKVALGATPTRTYLIPIKVSDSTFHLASRDTDSPGRCASLPDDSLFVNPDDISSATRYDSSESLPINFIVNERREPTFPDQLNNLESSTTDRLDSTKGNGSIRIFSVENPVANSRGSTIRFKTDSPDNGGAHSDDKDKPSLHQSALSAVSVSSWRFSKSIGNIVKGLYTGRKSLESSASSGEKTPSTVGSVGGHGAYRANYQVNNDFEIKPASAVQEARNERKRVVKRLIQHTAWSNRRAEEELHKLVVESRIKALCPFVCKTVGRKNKIQLSLACAWDTNASSRSNTFTTIPVETQSSYINSIDDKTGTGHSNNSKGVSNTAQEMLWHNHVWKAIDPSNGRDGSEDSEDQALSHVRKQVLSKLEHECRHKYEHTIMSPILHTMIGYCHDLHGDNDRALSLYSSAHLIDSKAIMLCVARKFITSFPEGLIPKTKFGRKLNSVRYTPRGRTYSTDILASVSASSSPVMSPLSSASSTPRTFDISGFFFWASKFGDIVLLQAYRLITEMMHAQLLKELASLRGVPVPDLVLDSSYMLGCQRDRSGRSNEMMRRDAMNMSFRRRKLSIHKLEPERDKTAALNEHADVTAFLHGSARVVDPCELSITLVVRLRELVRSHFASPHEYTKTPDGFTQIQVHPESFVPLMSTSAFSEFEYEACKLQLCDTIAKINHLLLQTVALQGLTTNELTLFFCNIYNSLVVHGIIAKAKSGAPGASVYERNVFMKHTKYNIGGHVFSLLDIEHGVLRASSSDPLVFGPVSFSPSTFTDRDPRAEFKLKEPKPNVSFFLFTANHCTPPLAVLRDATTIDTELSKFTKLYVQRTVQVDFEKKILYLPEIFRIYWKDFGGNKNNVISMIRHHHTKVIADKLKQEKKNLRTKFITIDWNPQLVL